MEDAHDHKHAPGGADWADLVDGLEADATLFSPALTAAVEWLRQSAPSGRVSRILDLGSGPGVTTADLARAFPAAHVVAADGSAELLERARARAEQEGVAGRVETRCVDINDGVGDIEPFDVVWASMVLHHLDDLDGALRRLVEVIRPDGSLVVSEFGTPLQIVPAGDDLVRSGLWDRGQRAAADGLHAHLPHGRIADWPGRFWEAGFDLEDERDCVIERPAPLAPSDRQWLARQLQRIPHFGADSLGADDLAGVEELTNPDSPRSVWKRDDLFIRTSRTLYLARRPLVLRDQ